MAQQKTDATADKLSADVKALREQIEKLSEGQREIPLLRAEVIGQDKRLSDTINRIGDVNTWLSEFSIIVGMLTVLIAIASLFGFRYVVIRVKDEAEEWFGKNSRRLKRKIAALEREAEDATARIQGHTRDVADVAAKSKADIKEHGRRVADIIARPINDDRKLNPDEELYLRQADDQAMRKPEKQYTAEDWSVRAYNAYAAGNLDKAAVFWGNVSETPGVMPIQIAQSLVNKGAVLWKLGRQRAAIDANNEVIERFGGDSDYSLRLAVAMAMVNKGIFLGFSNESIAVYDEVINSIKDGGEPLLRAQLAKAQANKVSTLVELGRVQEAILECNESEKKFGNDGDSRIKKYLGGAVACRGWGSYLAGNYAAMLSDSERALELFSDSDAALCNRAFSMYLNDFSNETVIAAYGHAWQVINDPAKWEKLALIDLRAHGRTVRTDSPPVPDDLIEAVAALAKGAE